MSNKTRIFRIDSDSPNSDDIKEAARILKAGGLVAFPTETVYGLGADATKKDAAKRIYAAKGRPSDNPLIVHISDMDMLSGVVKCVPDKAKKLADAFWPGPLTIIMEKSDTIPHETTGGLDTVAVRMPSRRVANLIIKECGIPIAAPSANVSGRPSTTRIEHIIEDFDGTIDAIVDDGPSPIGLESTIIDITGQTPTLLRRGFIRAFEIENVLGEAIEDTFGSKDPKKPKAPGMKYKHYSPRCELTIIKPAKAGYPKNIIDYADKDAAILCCSENKDLYLDHKVYDLGKKSNSIEIMQNLYGTLRQLDYDGQTKAYCESFEDTDHGDAIMERLIRASGHRIIE